MQFRSLVVLLVSTLVVFSAQSASVGLYGYTNDFSASPAVSDWSTATIAGGSGDVANAAGLDSAVQVLSASGITTPLLNDSGNPPNAGALASWSSPGQYLQTRPTGVKMSVLMATLINSTGTNVNTLAINYNFTAATSVAEEISGQRVYYSLSGSAGSWENIPALDSPSAGPVNANVTLSSLWNNGATLYLLWADDNGSGSPDNANQIDNFYVGAYYANLPLSVTLTSPAAGQHIGAGSTVSISVALTGSPTNVGYFLDGDLMTNRTATPYTPVLLPAQALGSHTIYATARDASDTLVSTVTNTFMVDLALSGTLNSDTTLYAANSPYTISGALTVPNGITLTIEPGTAVYLNSGVTLTVANGGRIDAEGTSNAPIRLTRPTTSSPAWGGITINGVGNSPETRFFYTYFEGNSTKCIEVNGGTIYLDHCSFGTTTYQYVSLDGSSFIISACYFPTTTAGFELLHGTGGIKAGGHGIVRDSFFGTTTGYNDIMDFTGGNRDLGQPIIQYYNNVFIGGSDDQLDLDGTDAWIEGNIFLHCHRNGSPDSSSGISGGDNGSDTSQITIIGNIFYDCDQAAMAKQGNFFTLLNNTVVHETGTGGQDAGLTAVVCLEDGGVAEGAGMYLEGNIIYDAEKLTRGVVSSIVTFTNNIISLLQGAPWTGLGGNNSTNDPMFSHVPQLSETYFTNWTQAQVMWDWFSLRPDSLGLGTGPNGLDKGAAIPYGVSISGAPVGTTTNTTADLTVGVNRTGNGIPSSGWPNGSGFTHYKWRLDTNAWSAEIPIGTSIALSNLALGPHHVEVIGKNDAGSYQNDPMALGTNALVTLSPTWTVQSALNISSITDNGTEVILHFPVVAGNTYSVLYKNLLADPVWQKLTDVAAQASGDYAVTNSGVSGQSRYYRLVMPAQ